MHELLTGFTANDFVTTVLVICAVFVAYKEVMTNWDWFKSRNKARHAKEELLEQIPEQLKEIRNTQDAMMRKHDERFNEIDKKFNEIDGNIQLLMKSDREDFKSELIEKHERFSARGCIDKQSLEILNHKYEYYKAEGGNSFAGRLMEDINKLPLGKYEGGN